MRPQGRSPNLLQSFNHAFDGLVHVFRHQRNLRIHFVAAILVLLACLFFDVSRLEFMAVLIAITFVLIAEMLNSAIEAAIDLSTTETDPRARVAKDVAAGAVLVASVNALVVAYFVFADKLSHVSAGVLYSLRRSPVYLTFVALALAVLIVIVIKATLGKGKALSGGLPSGHAAVAFGGWTAVTYISADTSYGILLSAVTFVMALLTAQSRVESGIHSVVEVALGAVLGIIVATAVFQLWF
jgi:diacylglycerol kinase (ATP)